MIKNEAASIQAFIYKKYKEVRQLTLQLCAPLETEDFVVQPIVDVSPPKWHLGHTTWFFEQFILNNYSKNFKEYNKNYNYVFNSYYESIGKRVLRTDRGNLTRPGVKDIMNYRYFIDNEMDKFLTSTDLNEEIINLIELGINHEQQHQELLMTDLKYILGHNPLFPEYLKKTYTNGHSQKKLTLSFLDVDEGIYQIGYDGSKFHFDNEEGKHKVFLHPYKIANRLINNREFLEFMNDDAYGRHELWLQEGFEWIKLNKINAPLYWHEINGEWYNYTLNGLQKVNPDDPVTHISFYEADAFAKWKNMRLATEFEWEVAAGIYSPVINVNSNFVEKQIYSPASDIIDYQFFGDAWEWTNSAYLPYPFYKKASGAVGEYNGKFMINQMVLRGGSCVTSVDHIRHTYRNFFHPDKRWQFTGIRLAQPI